MEHQDSFDLEALFSTPTDTDLGIPMSPPPLPLPPTQIMNTSDVVAQFLSIGRKERDVAAQPAEAVKLAQEFELPYFTCTPTDAELVQSHLRDFGDLQFGPAVVNADLPTMDPWELPGLAPNKGGMRDKYFLTDHRGLVFHTTTFRPVRTPNGFWKKQTSDTAIRAGHGRLVGIKRTMKFHPYRGDDAVSLWGTKANWIMNIYFRIDKFVEDRFVLCHVFETDSPDCNDKCLGCHTGACNGNQCGQEFQAPSNASFNSTHPRSRPMHHHDTGHLSDPMLNSYLAELEDTLLGGPDPDNSAEFEDILLGGPDPDNSADTGNSSARSGVPPTADHGHSKKRKKSSDVWDYFTKIFARDIDGKVLTFAACDHCCKILTGSSTGGTTHLARHACPCKFKPVEAGRNAKG